METEEIKIGDETIKIETRPITLVIPSTETSLGPPIRYPDRVEINPAETAKHIASITQLHPHFHLGWAVFAQSTTPAIRPEAPLLSDLRGLSAAMIHVCGLIDLSLVMFDARIPFVWKYPESGLHPGWQVGLADVLLWFMDRSKGMTNA